MALRAGERLETCPSCKGLVDPIGNPVGYGAGRCKVVVLLDGEEAEAAGN